MSHHKGVHVHYSNTYLDSFDSLKDFTEFAKSVPEIIIWTDFERANETHFWSPTKKALIEPEVTKSMGTRIFFSKTSS